MSVKTSFMIFIFIILVGREVYKVYLIEKLCFEYKKYRLEEPFPISVDLTLLILEKFLNEQKDIWLFKKEKEIMLEILRDRIHCIDQSIVIRRIK